MNTERIPKGARVELARGVYEDDIAPPGQRWFKVVTSSGKVGLVVLPTEMVRPDFTAYLWKQLDAADPERKLQII